MPIQSVIPRAERRQFVCMLDSATICPYFQGQGSGSGVNSTIICGNRDTPNRSGERVGERYVARAKKCLPVMREKYESGKLPAPSCS